MFTRLTVEHRDYPEGFEFQFGFRIGWLELVMACCFIAFAILSLFRGHPGMGILYFAMAVSSFASVAHSYSFTTVFTVSESGMHFPCTNGFFEEQMIHARDILALNYYDGFADEPKGLYLSSPNKRICLIRGLKAKEVDHILSAIRTRFPRLEQQPPTPKYADRVPDVIASNLKAAN